MLDFFGGTNLIERIIGVACYALTTLITYYWLLHANTYKKIKKALFFCILCLTILAFFFIPDESKDLYRIFEMTKGWKKLSWINFYNNIVMPSSTPVGFIYYYILVKTGLNGLLPAVTAFLFYSNVFHILKSLYKTSKMNCKNIALSFLFFMSAGSFLEVISDIRCFLAFAIATRLIVDELLFGKSFILHLPFYLVVGLLHVAVIPFIITRLVFLLVEYNGSFVKKMILLFVAIGFTVFFIYYFKSSIIQAFEKARGFIIGDTYSYVWEYLIGILQWILLVIYSIYLLRLNARISHNRKIRNLLIFSFIFLAIEMVLIFEYNIFHRYILISSIIFIPVNCVILNDYNSIKTDINHKTVFIFSSLIILTIACIRGNLCGFKFLDF